MTRMASLRDPLTALRCVLLALLVVFVVDTRSDMDLWGHVTFGEAIVDAHALPRTDPYSFTSDQPWINHEWLAEVIMGTAYRAAGPAGLIALRLTVVLAVIAFALHALRPTRRTPLVHDVALGALVVGIHAQTAVVRPQLWSILLFTVLLATLGSARRRLRWIVPPLFALWVNLHGGWIVGGAVLALWLAFDVIDRVRSRRPPWSPIGLGLASLGATLLNPYGPGMHRFLWDTVGPTRTDIQEWQPVYTLDAAFLGHWLFVAGFVALVALRSPRRLRPREWAIVLTLAVASFRLTRVIGFFAVAAVLLLAPHLRALAARRQAGPSPARRAPAVLAVCWTLAIGAGLWTVPRAADRLRCIAMRERVPEADVVRLVRSEGLRGRMITWFDWGQYAIWHLAPEVRVSYDGRRETVYGERVRALHRALYAATPAGRAYLDTLDADLAWLPTFLPAVDMLRAAGWSERFRGPVSVLLTRAPTGAATPARPAPGTSAPRCFPGP